MWPFFLSLKNFSTDLIQLSTPKKFTLIIFLIWLIFISCSNFGSYAPLQKTHKSKSPNWSKTPTDSKELDNYNYNKERLLENILDDSNFSGGINDTDYYTLEKWEDMPLGKLRKVMVIPYEENGELYAIAYYVKSLYKAWIFSIKNNISFVNPINKKPFTDKDKNDIFQCMLTIQPNLFPLLLDLP